MNAEIAKSFWAFGQPDDWQGGEDCVEMIVNVVENLFAGSTTSGNISSLNDAPCNKRQSHVCVKRAVDDLQLVPESEDKNPSWTITILACVGIVIFVSIFAAVDFLTQSFYLVSSSSFDSEKSSKG